MTRYFVLALAAIGAGYGIADSYVSRLPDHRGLYLVPVEDQVGVPLEQVPRHTVVMVIDGLRRDAAETLHATQTIAEHGQCFTTDVGMLSVSRPVYTELSTGLEQDRTGSRNNDDTSPVHVQSLWEIARGAGRSVVGVSALPWWQELFPKGFDVYRVANREENLFASPATADLTLLHPIYVDETSHAHGAKSTEYAAAIQTVDREVSPFLRGVDWENDLVLFTADHGHRDRGGHGAPIPDTEFVLTCIAGRGVTHNAARGALETRDIAPLLTVLLGLPFPRDMRAGDDTLDALWPITSSLPAPYLADRRRALEKFRAANHEALAKWGEASGSWQKFYAAKHLRQHAWWILVCAALLVLGRKRWRSLLWIALFLTTLVGLEIALRGSFDVNAINQRPEFIRGTLAACLGALLLNLETQRFISREPWRSDLARLVGMLFAINFAHILIYGWPLGFPLPEPLPFFVPFVSGIALMLAGIFLAAFSVKFSGRRGP